MSINSITVSTIYGADVRDALTTKLALFYYKTIRPHYCRLRVFTPGNLPPQYLGITDEVSLVKFNAGSNLFWNKFNLIKIQEFIKDSIFVNTVFLDQGFVVPDLRPFFEKNQDIIVLKNKDDLLLLRHVNTTVAKSCQLPVLKDSELISYDFSVLSVSEKAGEFLRKLLRQIIEKYPNEYISTDLMSAILSYSVALAKRFGVHTACSNTKAIDMRNEEFLGRFYAI